MANFSYKKEYLQLIFKKGNEIKIEENYVKIFFYYKNIY